MALSTVKVEVMPLNLTAVAPVKLVPVMVTAASASPLVGEKLAIVGAVDMGLGAGEEPPPPQAPR